MIDRAVHVIHKHFLLLLVLSYVLAGTAPAVGLWLRALSFGQVDLPGLGKTNLSISLFMLSFLLFNAGLGIQTKELTKLRENPVLVVAGFSANLLLPLLLACTVQSLVGNWHDPDEFQNLLVGLALIAAMPIAGSSAAWAQNANGNISLSLGLVLSSTILSPLTTPWILHFFGLLTHGDYAEDLHELANQGTNAFLCLTVVLPSMLGIAAHMGMGDARTFKLKPMLKLLNFVFLLMLNYSNASVSLPGVVSKPDWDMLALVVLCTFAICATAFSVGWLISRIFQTSDSDRASLMFGLGMNNNGTGLVLASSALADHPLVLLPMIFYTLAQQIIAAIVDARCFKNGHG